MCSCEDMDKCCSSSPRDKCAPYSSSPRDFACMQGLLPFLSSLESVVHIQEPSAWLHCCLFLDGLAALSQTSHSGGGSKHVLGWCPPLYNTVHWLEDSRHLVVGIRLGRAERVRTGVKTQIGFRHKQSFICHFSVHICSFFFFHHRKKSYTVLSTKVHK